MILINFASRSRPGKFHFCMENLSKSFTDYFVNLKIDRDDPTIREYLSVAYPEIILQIGKSESKVHAINRDIPFGWDVLINTSDDILWKPGAGGEILKHIETDTFLHFPEVYAENQAHKLKRESTCVVSIMDNIYYNRFGYVYNPEYKSIWCDTEATEVAKKLGRYKFVDKHIFEHLHPAAGKAKKDDQYRRTESFNVVDRKTFLARQSKNFYV